MAWGAPRETLAEQINSNGFRRWHEYELTRSFGYLGVGMIGLVAGLALTDGVMEIQNLPDRLFRITLSFAALWFTGWSWLKFILILIVAESVSRQAICDHCHRYGRIEIMDERSSEDLSTKVLTCRCQKCGHIWKMHYTLQWRDARI